MNLLDANPITSAVLGSHAADLHRIREPRLNLCVLGRTVAAEVEEFVRGVLLPGDLRRTAVCDPADPEVGGLLSGFPASASLAAFRADILVQLRLFAAFLDAPRYHLKLIATGDNQCERFHVDWVRLRSICTYAGPATEWLDNADVDRANLGPGAGGLPDEASGLLRPGASVRRLPLYAVAWLKGSRWPGNADGGMIHRSPRVLGSGQRRVVFKIDADTKEPHHAA